MTPDPLARITAALLDGERFVLASHVRPDGDSIGSQLALAHALRALGKTARIVNHDAPPAYLRTLPGADGIEVAAAVNGRFDAAVVLECGTLERTEVVGLDRQPVVNIDHHAGNAMYGALNWFDPTAAACAEMVHDLIAALGVALTPDIGAALYAGILTDTGSFRHANITARTFETCRNAAACGVDAAALAAAIYQNSSLGKLRLTGRVLNEMRLAADGRIAVLRPGRRSRDHVPGARRSCSGQPAIEGTRRRPRGGRGIRRRRSSQCRRLHPGRARAGRRVTAAGAHRGGRH